MPDMRDLSERNRGGVPWWIILIVLLVSLLVGSLYLLYKAREEASVEPGSTYEYRPSRIRS